MRTVKDIFETKQKSFNFIDADALVIDALTMMQSVNLSYVVVMQNGEYKGIFGEREYARNVILKGRASNNTKVIDAMTIDIPVVAFTDTVEHCMQVLNSHKTRYLLAYDNQHFAGVITINDLLRQVLMFREIVFDHAMTQQLLDTHEGDRVF